MKNRRLDNLRSAFGHNRQAVFAACFLLCVVLVCTLISLTLADPNAINVTARLDRPSTAHWLGTDELGRDYLSRLLYGGRVSLLVGVLAMSASILMGVAVGLCSGYFGGLADSILMRMADVFSAIPWLILVTVVNLLIHRGVFSIILSIGLFSWMETARMVRAETMTYKEREYVRYAGFIGIPPGRIVIRHILPGVLPTVITSATDVLARAIMTESAMSFLGIGVQQPLSSWGSLLQNAQGYLESAPYMAMVPGILIVLTIYSFNKLGDVVRSSVQISAAAGAVYE